MKNRHLLFWSITVALGGFLFGFDTAVISGAEQTIQRVWDLNSWQHGLTVSIALMGTVVGALFGGIPSDKLGRQKTLFWIAVFYLVSALGSALATDWYLFLSFRFLGGLGVGASSVAAPLYISEIAPPASRGRLVALFQFNVVFGILMAYLSNALIGGHGPSDWRWMLGMEAIPAILFQVLVLFVPESPRWLILKRNEVARAREILSKIDPVHAEQEVAAILNTAELDVKTPAEPFFSKRYRLPITLAVLFAMFNQLSGINAIIYYAPRIFGMTGLGTESALLSTAGIGLINFLSTLLALNFIDRFGRRALMKIGSWGLIATLGLVAYAFFTETFGYWVPIYLFVYIAFFAFSQGAVIWVFISEIFPNRVRAYGQALGSFTHWLLAAIVSFAFPVVTETLGGGVTFSIFCGMMILQLLFVWKMMPETKGKSLEQLEENLYLHENV
ncbi:MFS transporter, sugar porter (SP) family [Catalinimonas alkaloidigena]|uniref:MFS transporter, sugar porter (SP) family n=1 Tax=Catalinimonas alkaloidigena TaxID=1075417 RepID=A0A1G8WYD6_9BACT|nr:sugar porter family MFS transporter [Catalinimonas alkaloidigena]SDJ83389.1 MFS transporter, sugar porter (SP) family [Catalinimonas alkaloidigena]